LASKSIRFTGGELEALYELARYALRSPDSVEDPDASELRRAARKLRQAALDALCSHCKDRFSRRNNGLCDPCHTYQEKYGVLPATELLGKRTVKV
jgi:hypothetical protein